MELGDIWVKVANNLRLTPEEQEFLRLEGRNTQLRNTFVAGNTNAAGVLDIKFPFELIFSEEFQENKTSFTVQVPQDYKHLLIMGAGRNLESTTNAGYFLARMNGDATIGAYKNAFIFGAGANVTGVADGSAEEMVIGSLADDGNDAGEVNSFFSFLLNVSSARLYKSAVSVHTSQTTVLYITSGVWSNLSEITSITFFAGASMVEGIKAGTIISIYGIR